MSLIDLSALNKFLPGTLPFAHQSSHTMSAAPTPRTPSSDYRLVLGPPDVTSYLALRLGSGLSPKTEAQAIPALRGAWGAYHVGKYHPCTVMFSQCHPLKPFIDNVTTADRNRIAWCSARLMVQKAQLFTYPDELSLLATVHN